MVNSRPHSEALLVAGARHGIRTTLANADKARNIALEVARRLHRSQAGQPPDTNGHYDPGLAGGDAGLAVLFGYLDRIFPQDGWDKIAHEVVLRISKSLSRSSGEYIGLFGGLAGLAFITYVRWSSFVAILRWPARSVSAYRGCFVAQMPWPWQELHSLKDMALLVKKTTTLITGISGVQPHISPVQSQ